MPSQVVGAIWPDSVNARQVAQNVAAGDTQAVFASLVAEAIAEELQDGLFTASVSTSGQASADVQYVTAALNCSGYQATVTGTNLVINW